MRVESQRSYAVARDLSTRPMIFTLPEALVILCLIGVLIALVTPNVVGLLNAAREDAFYTDHRLIQMAVDQYYLSIAPGYYPTNDLTAPGVISFTRLIQADLLRAVPQSAEQRSHPDAPGGGHYTWAINASGVVTTTFQKGVFP